MSTAPRVRGSQALGLALGMGWETQTLIPSSYMQEKQIKNQGPSRREILLMPLLVVIFFYIFCLLIWLSEREREYERKSELVCVPLCFAHFFSYILLLLLFGLGFDGPRLCIFLCLLFFFTKG